MPLAALPLTPRRHAGREQAEPRPRVSHAHADQAAAAHEAPVGALVNRGHPLRGRTVVHGPERKRLGATGHPVHQ